MWIKISTHNFFVQMVVGNFITENPPDPLNHYKITFASLIYVNALHINRKLPERTFHLEDLVNGNWWVRSVVLN